MLSYYFPSLTGRGEQEDGAIQVQQLLHEDEQETEEERQSPISEERGEQAEPVKDEINLEACLYDDYAPTNNPNSVIKPEQEEQKQAEVESTLDQENQQENPTNAQTDINPTTPVPSFLTPTTPPPGSQLEIEEVQEVWHAIFQIAEEEGAAKKKQELEKRIQEQLDLWNSRTPPNSANPADYGQVELEHFSVPQFWLPEDNNREEVNKEGDNNNDDQDGIANSNNTNSEETNDNDNNCNNNNSNNCTYKNNSNCKNNHRGENLPPVMYFPCTCDFGRNNDERRCNDNDNQGTSANNNNNNNNKNNHTNDDSDTSYDEDGKNNNNNNKNFPEDGNNSNNNLKHGSNNDNNNNKNNPEYRCYTYDDTNYYYDDGFIWDDDHNNYYDDNNYYYDDQESIFYDDDGVQYYYDDDNNVHMIEAE